jgi:hypothetical protein
MTVIENANPTLRRRTLLGTAVALLGLAGGASAYVGSEPADLQVVDRDTGEPLRVWRARGRLYVAGEPGDRYALRVANRTGGRVLVVLSVDGVNVVTGQTASYAQNGYVFDPYETYDVTGWRKSRTEVAAFAFAPLSQSYAARTGRPGDVGVIGMAVFREKYVEPPPPPPPPPMILPESRDGLDRGAAPSTSAARRAAAAAPEPAPPKAAAQPSDAAKAYGGLARREDERLGTAHGAREHSYVDMTTFERATRYPECVRQIEYDTYAHLVASGVIPRIMRDPVRPRPFPLAPDGGGFVPDPPG